MDLHSFIFHLRTILGILGCSNSHINLVARPNLQPPFFQKISSKSLLFCGFHTYVWPEISSISDVLYSKSSPWKPQKKVRLQGDGQGNAEEVLLGPHWRWSRCIWVKISLFNGDRLGICWDFSKKTGEHRDVIWYNWGCIIYICVCGWLVTTSLRRHWNDDELIGAAIPSPGPIPDFRWFL